MTDFTEYEMSEQDIDKVIWGLIKIKAELK